MEEKIVQEISAIHGAGALTSLLRLKPELLRGSCCLGACCVVACSVGDREGMAPDAPDCTPCRRPCHPQLSARD